MVLINSSSSLQGCKLTFFLSYLTVYVFLLYLFFFPFSNSFSTSSSVAMVTLCLSHSLLLSLWCTPTLSSPLPPSPAAGWMVAIETDLFKRRAKKLSFFSCSPQHARFSAPSLPPALSHSLPLALFFTLPQSQGNRPTLFIFLCPRLYTHINLQCLSSFIPPCFILKVS